MGSCGHSSTLCQITSITFRSVDPSRGRGFMGSLVFHTFVCADFAEWRVTLVPMFLPPHPNSRLSDWCCQFRSCANVIPDVSYRSFVLLGVPFENDRGHCLVVFSCFPFRRFSPLPHIYHRQSIISPFSYNVAYSITVSKIENQSLVILPTHPYPSYARSTATRWYTSHISFRGHKPKARISYLTGEHSEQHVPPNVMQGICVCSSDTSSVPRLYPHGIHLSPSRRRRGVVRRHARQN